MVNSWLDLLKYNNLINYFYFFKVKRIEGRWAWLLIVFSSLSSCISLFQFQESNEGLETTSKVLLGIFTLFTTLVAAWMKKQNYIERVSELDKYILKTSKIIGALEADLEMPLDNRMEFPDFMKKYKELIVEFNSITPLISPDDWKETVYEITKFYPEIAYEFYPWKNSDNFGQSIIDTYRYIKYNSFMKRLLKCFYCQGKCCMKKYDSSILEKNITNIYKNKILRGDLEKGLMKNEGIGLFTNPNNLKLNTNIYNVENVENIENNNDKSFNTVNDLNTKKKSNTQNQNQNQNSKITTIGHIRRRDNTLGINEKRKSISSKGLLDLKQYLKKNNISNSSIINFSDPENKYKIKIKSPKKEKSGNTRGFVI